jgi:hypothetical protein
MQLRGLGIHGWIQGSAQDCWSAYILVVVRQPAAGRTLQINKH